VVDVVGEVLVPLGEVAVERVDAVRVTEPRPTAEGSLERLVYPGVVVAIVEFSGERVDGAALAILANLGRADHADDALAGRCGGL
jgi:hypothetical protein